MLTTTSTSAAFQLVDDVLDYSGDLGPSQNRRRPREGKMTCR
jgi:geranylgeranyl pyrophosphate synthase